MEESPETEVESKVARIHAVVLATVMGFMGAAGLFLMTAWLVVKGGTNPGAHLQLLSNYFPGYSVTWFGSVVGLAYGALLGALIGWSIGMIYNRVAGS